jgi:SAM-dependent methyltransferase
MGLMKRIGSKLLEIAGFLRHGSQRDIQTRQRLDQLETRLNDQQRHLEDWQRQLTELTSVTLSRAADADLQFVRNSLAADIARESQWLRDRISALAHAAGSAGGAGPQAAPVAVVQSALQEAFYPALEQQFRGTLDEIRARQLPYQPWIAGAPEGPVADIGCGRGEWLGLLKEWGRDGVGVDLNAVMVEELQARGLHAVHADALVWLRQQADSSLAAITSFHVVEHLPLGVLLQLVDEARRVLKPAGLLILETPNPENLLVATQSFWLDPTHQRPIPPGLLEFMAVHAGLRHETTLRLSPPDMDGDAIADPTLRALMMQGRDYAVVARRPG